MKFKKLTPDEITKFRAYGLENFPYLEFGDVSVCLCHPVVKLEIARLLILRAVEEMMELTDD